MQSADIKRIAEALAMNRVLKTLNLSYNPKSGPEGAVSFSQIFAINTNSALRKIVFDGCQAGDEGAKKVIYLFLIKFEIIWNLIFFVFFPLK